MGFTNRNGGMLPPLKWWSFTNMVGKLPDWNDWWDGSCWDIWKIFGLLFLQVPCKKNWMKPTTIDFWSEISHVDAPLWKSPDWSSNHITSSPTNHRNSRRGSSPIDASIPGRFTHIPWWFFVVATMARPMAHLLLAMCSTSLGVVAISQVWVDL